MPAPPLQETDPEQPRPTVYGGNSSGFGQEQFVWDIKTEPGVLEVFEKLWGTDKLVVSFDGGSLMLPGVREYLAGQRLDMISRADHEFSTSPAPPSADDASWQHIDCSPHRKGFFCAQGLVNLSECDRDDDGGLLVMEGSSRLMKRFFDENGRPPLPTHERLDWHMFSNEDKQWFIDQGCKWFKVNCNPGDVVLWDSSTMHQNQPPASGRDRFVVCEFKVSALCRHKCSCSCSYALSTDVCMGPAHLLTDEDKRVREKAFNEKIGTTHTPFHGCYSFPLPETAPIRPETGKPDEVSQDWARSRRSAAHFSSIR